MEILGLPPFLSPSTTVTTNESKTENSVFQRETKLTEMAESCVSEDLFRLIGKARGFEMYYKLQPGTNYDGKKNVLLSLSHVFPEILHGSIPEIPFENNPQSGDFNNKILHFRRTVQDGVTEDNFKFDFVAWNSLTSSTSSDERKDVLKSFLETMRHFKENKELSDVRVFCYDGDDNELKEIISAQAETETLDERSNPPKDGVYVTDGRGKQESEKSSEFCRGIGTGLALTYFVDHLQPIINKKEQVQSQNGKKLLPFMVVDCSNDCSENRGLKGTDWIGSCVFRNRNPERFLKNEVFQFERDETVSVIVDRPEPLRILSYLHSKGKLSVEEFNREIEDFRRMLLLIVTKIETGHERHGTKRIIAKHEAGLENHQTKCIIYDGKHLNMADHIWNCGHNLSDSLPNAKKPVVVYNEDDDGIEVDGAFISEVPPNFEYDGNEEKVSDDHQEVRCTKMEEMVLEQIAMQVNDITIKDVVYVEDVINPVTEEVESIWSLSPALDLNVLVRDKKDISLITEMVVAGLKQENQITIPTVQHLTDDNQQWSSHQRAGLVLELLLSIFKINIALYPRIVKSLEGLRQRAAASQDKDKGGRHEDNSRSRNSSAARETPREESPISKDKKHDSKAPKLNGPEARLQIVSNILFTMIEDKKYFPYDFEVQLRKFVFESKQDISKLRNKDGLSLLHAIVYNNRPQFILPIFRAGCWNDIKGLKGDKGLYEGKTADDICTELKYRKVQKEMDNYVIWEKSMNPIHIAARKSDLNEVKKLLKFSEDLHYVNDDNGCTSLYWAVVGGNAEIVNLLLQKKVDHEKMNTKKETLLHVACVIGHSHLLTTLIKDLKMDLTLKDSTKKSPLLRVAENGDEKSLAKIMKCGLKKEQLGPLLAIAGHYGRLGFIKKVIEEYYVDPGSKDDVGKTAFMRACEQSRIEVAKYLLTRSIIITETDIRRRNVLHMAADGAGIEMMEFLIEEIKKKGDTVLKGMLNQRDKYIGGELCMLIRGKDKGRDSWHYVEVSRGLMDIFMKKTRSGTIDVAKYGTLLHSGWGVDPDEESAKQIEKRFETRRNANMSEDQDMTPLHIAAFKDKPDLAELLMKNGSDLNSRDKFGLTPLHIASMRGNIALVRLMLEKGAMSDVLDNLIKTPVEVAEDNEHKDVAAFIRSLQYIPIAQNFREAVLPNFTRLIAAEYIRQLQETGGDVRTHLINTLRDLTIDINETLLALGSGPVLEESTSSDPHTKH